MEVRHDDFSSPIGNNEAEDQDCDSCELQTGLSCRGALRDLGADGVEVSQSRRSPKPEPHATPVEDDSNLGAAGRCAAQGAPPNDR